MELYTMLLTLTVFMASFGSGHLMMPSHSRSGMLERVVDTRKTERMRIPPETLFTGPEHGIKAAIETVRVLLVGDSTDQWFVSALHLSDRHVRGVFNENGARMEIYNSPHYAVKVMDDEKADYYEIDYPIPNERVENSRFPGGKPGK